MYRLFRSHVPMICLLLLLSKVYAQDRLSGRYFSTRSEVLATHGMAATSHPLATQIALDVLKKGGSAVDAAIAANAFLGFADPGMCGVGGDLFAIVWDAKSRKLYGLNASGRSPRRLTLDYLQNEEKKGNHYYKGILSVTTPGCVDGWFALHSRFGRLPVATLLQPAIAYCKFGVPVTQETADNFAAFHDIIDKQASPSFRKLFMIGGRMPQKGEIFKNPALAATLEEIARNGRAGFYTGRIAATIDRYMKSRGGFLSSDDLSSDEPTWVEPVSTNYRGYDVWELPPNGQGVATLQILNLLEGYDIAKMGYGSADYIHHFLEAKKLAYEDLAVYYGDPAFNKERIPLEKLLSKQYAAERRSLIDSAKAGIFEPGMASTAHTVYLTVADSAGNMVSFIQSLSGLFGSMEVPDGLGFALQNRGGDFVLQEKHINSFAPGKRPFHTIMPGFVTLQGAPYLSFGVMGGDMQPQGQAQVLINVIDFGMNLQEAGDAPRVFHDGTTNYGGHLSSVGDTYLESGFSPEVVRALLLMGHNIKAGSGIFGGYQAIMLKNGVYYGASDPRKDGQAGGY